MGLEWDIRGSDGKRYAGLGEMVAAETDNLIAETVGSVGAVIRKQYCETHGEYAQVTMGQSGSKYAYEITGCCDELCRRAEVAAGAEFE